MPTCTIRVLMASDYCVHLLLQDPGTTVLDGSDWTDAALLTSQAGFIGALDAMELSHILLVLGPFNYFLFACSSLLLLSVGNRARLYSQVNVG